MTPEKKDPIMQRRSVWASVGGGILAAVGLRSARADTGGHKVVFHVGSADPAMMHVALGNVANAADYYAARGEGVAIELVANGPGYTMLRADTSPVKAHLEETQRKYPFVVFAACQHSRAGMAAAEHKSVQEIPQVSEAVSIESGVGRLTDLQEQHYAYIRV